MNYIHLLGRLVKDPETKYSQGTEPVAITRYTLAVDRKFKKTNEPNQADFFNVVAFGKAGEFADKYFKKGLRICVTGRMQNNNWTDKDGNKRYGMDVVVENQDFADGKAGATGMDVPVPENLDGFHPADLSGADDDLPF